MASSRQSAELENARLNLDETKASLEYAKKLLRDAIASDQAVSKTFTGERIRNFFNAESQREPAAQEVPENLSNGLCKWFYERDCDRHEGSHCECMLATRRLQMAGFNIKVVLDGINNRNCLGNIGACHVIGGRQTH